MGTKGKGKTRPGGKVGDNGLTLFQELFLEAYVANGGNATRAYLTVHPGDVTTGSAAAEACKLLKLPKVREHLETRRQERFQQLAMEGDEAIALLSVRARANLADAFDERGKLLPFKQWPETLQLAVRSFDGDKITLYDGLAAAKLMAMATGRLKTVVDLNVFDPGEYLAGMDEPPKEGKS